MTIDEITSRFNIKSSTANSVQAICPVHKDKRASLSITRIYDDTGNEKIVMHCHAGCKTRDILQSVGLEMKDLFATTNKPKIQTGLDKCIKHYENKGKKYIESYHYKDENGNYLYSKLRFLEPDSTKTFIYARCNATEWTTGRGCDPVLYRLNKVVQAVNAELPIYIVEGEKDVHTLEKMGYVATTSGGAGTWKEEYAKHFRSASVIILPDNDESGAAYAKDIIKSIKKIAYRYKSVTISSDQKGDITDFVNNGNSIDDVKRVLAEHDWNYAKWVRTTNSNTPKGIDQYTLAVTINSFIDYIVMDINEKNKPCTYVYNNGIYININKNPFISRYIMPFLPHDFRTNNNFDEIYKHLCLVDDRFKTPDDFDQDENIINVKNGLFNVKEFKLYPHTPAYYSLKQLNVNFNEQPMDHGHFNGFIETLTEADDELKSVILEFMGITFSNIPTHYTKKLLMLQGKGDTGKSQLIKIINNIMGSTNIKAMPPHKLADRFTMSACHDKGLVFCADAPSDALKDLSVIKSMTGGDTISAENKGGAYYDVLFNGSIIIACNDKPKLDGDNGKHMYDRVLLIPCNNVIPLHEQDPQLFKKLQQDKEYIFYIAMEHLHKLMTNNYKFTQSETIQNELYQYQIQDDDVLQWLNSEFVEIDTEIKCTSRELHRSYREWCEEQGIKDPKKALEVCHRLKQLGYENGKRGNSTFYSIKILN